MNMKSFKFLVIHPPGAVRAAIKAKIDVALPGCTVLLSSDGAEGVALAVLLRTMARLKAASRLAGEREEHGKGGSVLSISRNMTARRKFEPDYQMLFHEMMDGFALSEIIGDEDGRPVNSRFLAVNRAFEEMIGVTAEDVLGKTLLEVFPTAEQAWIRIRDEAALTGKPVVFEVGAGALEKTFGVKVFSPAPGQLAAVFSDISEHKRVEESLQTSEERFAKAFQTSPYAIAITRAADGQFIQVNAVFSEMTGFSRQEAMASSSVGLKLWADEHERARIVAAMMAGKSVVGEECLFNTKDGGKITGLFSAQVLQLNSEPFILSSINDISEAKRLEEEARTTAQRLETLLSSLSAGVLSVSADGTVELVNQAFCDLFGLTAPPTSYCGLRAAEMVGVIKDQYADPAETIARIQEVTSQGLPVGGQEVLLQDGRILLVDFVPVYVEGQQCGHIWHHMDITERQRANVEMQEARDLLDSIVENVPLMIFLKEAQDLRFVVFNKAGEDLLGYDREALLGKNDADFFPQEQD